MFFRVFKYLPDYSVLFFLFSEYYLFYHLNSSFILCPKEDDSPFGDFTGMHLLIDSFTQHVSIDNNYISDTRKDIGILKHKKYRPFLRHYMRKVSCLGQFVSRPPRQLLGCYIRISWGCLLNMLLNQNIQGWAQESAFKRSVGDSIAW